jgi:glycosyltransferase involved in cell wall biosynthesis
LKVAFVLKYFLPEQVAGTEIYVAALCLGLKNEGVDVLIIKPGYDQATTIESSYKGLRIISYPESSYTDRKLITGERKPDGINAFEEVLINEKTNFVHFHEISGSNGITIEHLRVAKKLNIPVFITLHIPGYVCKTDMFKYKGVSSCDGVINIHKCSICVLHNKGIKNWASDVLTFLGVKLLNYDIDISALPDKISGALSYPLYVEQHLSTLHEIFAISEKVFVLSSWFKEVLLKNSMPENKMVLLPKALPVLDNPEVRVIQYEPERSEFTRFVYLGRISEIKGLHLLLEALLNVDEKRWSLDIYGQALDEEYLMRCKRIADKVKGNIRWQGIVKPTAVVSTLQQYDALVFPTVIEEMVGLVVQEAFVAGVPVIGSDVSGIKEQLKDGVTGLLFESGHVIQLSKILHRVINDKELLKLLKKNIESPLQFDEVTLKVLAVYNRPQNI